jgi:PQQ-dependent dehydrogenase (methanol/ethanol family)
MDRRNFLTRAGTAAGATAIGGAVAAPAAADPHALPVPDQPASFGRTGRDYPKVCGDLGNQNHSTLSRVNRRTVGRLGGAWHVNLEGGAANTGQQSTIVAQDGVLYVQSSQQNVFAFDGRTGALRWKTNLGPGTSNMRGVALGNGLVYSTSDANKVFALDQATGRIVWERELLNEAGFTQAASLAGALVHWDGIVFVGMSGSTGGARGRCYGLDAATGAVRWTFWAVPGPDEYGHDTWEGESWRTGGAVPWIHPAVDPDLGCVYYTFGNPYPRLDGSTRGGDNLFANSMVALDAKTGVRRWHFQSIHHDIWDYDNVMAPVLIDLRIGNRTRKVVVYGSKSCHYFVLDRATGAPVHGVEERPVPQERHQKTAPTQPFPGGEPFVHPYPSHGDTTRPVPFYESGGIFTTHWDRPVIIYPGAGGGADWSHVSFNPRTGWLYTGYGLINSGYSNTHEGRVNTSRPLGEYQSGGIVAMDPRTNTVVWRREGEWSLAHGNGILTTDGGVMFQGHPDGFLVAMDDTDGAELWRFQTGAGVHTSPIAYEVGGEQYIAVLAGGNGLPYQRSPMGDHLWAFKVGGSVAPAPTPLPPLRRRDITGTPVPGAAANNTVTLGRIWNAATAAPGTTENTVAQNAMAPQSMVIPVGTTVTFVNPADNRNAHAAVSFFEDEFDTGLLMPGQSVTHTFAAPGEFFYNDAVYPQSTGKIIVQ